MGNKASNIIYKVIDMSPEFIVITVGSFILLLFGIAVLVALRLLSAARYITNDSSYSIISSIGWIIITGGTVGLLISPVGILAFFGWILIIIVVIETTRQHRRTQQNALLWSMAISAEKSVPLDLAIEAFAHEGQGLIKLKAKKLAELLKSGVSLPEALDKVPGLLPAPVLTMIHSGHESGTLSKTLRQALTSRDLFAIIWSSLIAKLLYIFFVICTGGSIVLFVIYKIIPSYEKIFRDFGRALPPVTQALIRSSHFIQNNWYIFVPLDLLFVGVAIYIFISYLGWVPFYLPGVGRLMRRRHTAAILDSLALAAEYNRPVGNSIATLAASYPLHSIRRKLKLVEKDVTQGSDWCESLYQHGLIKSVDKAVLKAAQRVNNLPWAMREMADSNRRRLAYRLNALVQLAYPPVILCLGVIVMFIVVSIFLPLISLISKLSFI